jgi:hypothetical protein
MVKPLLEEFALAGDSCCFVGTATYGLLGTVKLKLSISVKRIPGDLCFGPRFARERAWRTSRVGCQSRRSLLGPHLLRFDLRCRDCPCVSLRPPGRTSPFPCWSAGGMESPCWARSRSSFQTLCFAFSQPRSSLMNGLRSIIGALRQWSVSYPPHIYRTPHGQMRRRAEP